MKRIGMGLTTGLAAATLALAASTAAAGEISLIPVLNISGQYSDNIFYEPVNTHSDTFILVNPGVSFDYASRSVVLSLGYQAGIQRFTTFDERDNVIQRFDANVGFNFGRGFAINLVDNLASADDPLAFDASGDRLQRDSYIYNHFSPAVTYTFGSRNIILEGRYDRVDVDYDTLTDSEQNGFLGRVGARLGSKSSLNFEYVWFDRKFDGDSPWVEDYTGQRFAVSVDRQLTPRASVLFTAGWEERKFDQQGDPSDDFDNGVFGIDFVGEFPEIFSMTAGYNRRLNDLTSVGVYVVDRFNLELRRTFADRVRTSFNMFWQHSDNEQLVEEFDMLGFQANGEYLVAKFLNVFLGYEYLDRDTEVGGIDSYTENRFNFGLSVSYGI